MKKILSLFLALTLLFALAACGDSAGNPTNTPANNPSNSPTENPGGTPTENPGATPTENPGATPTEKPGTDNPPPSAGGPTDIDFASEVAALEGEWKLSKVFVDGETADAAAGALTFKVTLEQDPYELVDGAAYIHNIVYNASGVLTFGMDSVVAALEEEDIDSYKGSTSWEDFPQGKVMADGAVYEQPGPALMRFKDIDELGLFLDEIAGIGGDVDTTNKSLIIGMNSDGQLLLGYSDEHIERPGTSGEWEYLLIFDK